MAGKKILMIEDNPINAELVIDLLELEDHEVIHAENAEIGIELAPKENPDLILMDVGLPGIDGLEATRILKNDEKTKHITIVVLTSHAMKGDNERAKEAGSDGYITKPIDTREFPEQVAKFLPKT
jgi:CheY-like chemotaxis protein